ncbi:MAG: hypothetical protein J7L44_02465 [Candidatus Diapherotrites archaeon]|nr:hypothetical protein [Candidatus Diapherotrites archaeon]
MAIKKKKKAADKWKKKRWFKVHAPKIFKEIVLGETPAERENQLLNRTIEVSVGELTGQRKFMPIIARLRVTKVTNDRANTELVGCRVDTAYLKRIVRRRRTKVDSIVTAETADRKKVRVTATTICGARIESKKETHIRKAMGEEIINDAKKCKFDEFMQHLMFGNIAQKIMGKIKGVAPIQRIEIVKARLLEGKRQ